MAKAHVEWVKNQIKTDSGAAGESGNCSAASNTGNCSAASNTGNRSAASNTGDCSAASNTGDCSIAVAWGAKSKARAALGSYIVVAEYDEAGDFIGAKMGKVDGKRLKANVYYTLCNGKFVKAEED